MPALAGDSEVIFDATVMVNVQRTEMDGDTAVAAGASVFLHAYAGVDEERDRPVQSLEAVADGSGKAVLTGVARAADGAPVVDLRVIGAATETEQKADCTVTTDYQGSVMATSAPGTVEVRLGLAPVGSTEDCAPETATPPPTPLPTPRPTTKVRPTPIPTPEPTPTGEPTPSLAATPLPTDTAPPTASPSPSSAPDPTADPTAPPTPRTGGDSQGGTGGTTAGAAQGGTIAGPATGGRNTSIRPAGSERQGAAAPGRAGAPALTPPATDTAPAVRGSTSEPRIMFLLGIALLGTVSASVLVTRRLRSHIA